MFSKTMEFCNKGVVRADPPPPPPIMVKYHIFAVFLPFPNGSYIKNILMD